LVVVAGSANLAQAHHDLAAADPDTPSYGTVRRAVLRIDAGVAAAIVRAGGRESLIDKRVYLKVGVSHRNQRWIMDSQEIPVRIAHGSRGLTRKFWQTTAIDDATRMVMGTVISADRPNSDDVAACIAIGIRGHAADDGTFIGGVPDEIVWDNAKEFLSDHVTSAAVRLAFTGTATNPHSPYEKGKIERWHRTIQTELFAKMPGSTQGPHTFSGQEVWTPTATGVLTEPLLVAYSLLWIREYNQTRAHSSLDGQTPLDVWKADPNPVRRAGAEALYDAMFIGDQSRVVGKSGVIFHNEAFLCTELNAHAGRRVQVRYLPHDDSFIEVFLDGEHLGTAYPSEKSTKEQRRSLLVERRGQYEDAKRLMKTGAELRQQRFEDAVANGERPCPRWTRTPRWTPDLPALKRSWTWSSGPPRSP
jgi:putative transposase